MRLGASMLLGAARAGGGGGLRALNLLWPASRVLDAMGVRQEGWVELLREIVEVDLSY